MLEAIEKLQKKASQPIDSKGTFDSLEKGFGSILVDAKNLLNELEKISNLTTKDKISLLPEGESKKLKEALTAVSNYEKAVEKLEKKRVRNVEIAKASKEEMSSKLLGAKADADKKRGAYASATAKGTAYGDAQAIVQQAEAAKKAKKEEKKEKRGGKKEKKNQNGGTKKILQNFAKPY